MLCNYILISLVVRCFAIIPPTASVFESVRSSGGSVMVVSGVSSPVELCLAAGAHGDAVVGATVSLEPCSDSIREGGGAELFTYDDGALMHVNSKLCLEVASGLVLAKCENASKFELQGNGQMKISGSGNLCLSQNGPAPGIYDVAGHAAAAATSSAASSHSASMAVDGRATYWASKLDPALPVELSVDFGRLSSVASAMIQWEYPAKSFSVLISADGAHWEEVFSTDVNGLKITQIDLGGRSASKAKVVMHEVHPVYGKIHGHGVFGISAFSIFSNQMQTIAEDCAHAEKSADARDKYFLVGAGVHGESPLKHLQADMPALDVAEASLSTVTAAINEVLPLVSSCTGGSGSSFIGLSDDGKAALQSRHGTNNPDFDTSEMLFNTARDAILKLRGAMN